ncbi:MAG: imidazoleglycerol-phosphate dehydratase HisB [Hydrogenophilus sp.]|nr:imidazoleglycerol-phosphate dehydratase HisB [Hydrogenophilus sp.]
MRRSEVKRKTNETSVEVAFVVEGSGHAQISSGVPFLDHMLEQVARHGLFDLSVKAEGDRQVDDHHTVEDVGITLGQALALALGEKKGVQRFGSAYVPLDEALSRVVVDLSGRPMLVFHCRFTAERIGSFDTQLVREFFQGFVNHAAVTLHVDNLRGENAHHQAETIFKAFGRALRMAVALEPAVMETPSTKGRLVG